MRKKLIIGYTVHTEVWYPCPECGTVFIKRKQLGEHMKKEHLLFNERLELKFLKPQL